MADGERKEIVEKFPEEYRYTNDEGEQLLEVENVLRDLNEYYTGDKLSGGTIDMGSSGGLFIFSDPNSHPLDRAKLDLIRAFQQTLSEMFLDRETIEEHIPQTEEVTAEAAREVVEENMNHFFGFGIKDSILSRFEQMLKNRKLNRDEKPGEKPQPNSQTTL